MTVDRSATPPGFGFDRTKYGPRILVDVLRYEKSWKLEGDRSYRLLCAELWFVQSGRATLEIDSVPTPLSPRTVCLSPAGAMRRLSHDRGLRAIALLIDPAFAGEVAWDVHPHGRPGGLAAGVPRAAAMEHEPFARLSDWLVAIERELLAIRPDTPALVHAAALPVLLEADRLLHETVPDQRGAQGARHLAMRFQSLVLERYDRWHRVEEYCRELAVSRKHLATACARVFGVPPHTVIRRRVLLEARRLLAYTTLSNEQIAARLGFTDGAHLARAFRAHEGLSPKRFRDER
jgi:AraC-like DNA-binding protein